MTKYKIFVQYKGEPEDLRLDYVDGSQILIWELKGYWSDGCPQENQKESFILKQMGDVLKIWGEQCFSTIKTRNNKCGEVTLRFEGRSHLPCVILPGRNPIKEGYTESVFTLVL